MTVAIGLVCNDGVLVASDSMASNQMIAVSAVKVQAFEHNPVVWTSAGSVYVKEEVEAELSARLDDKPNAFFTEPKTLLLRGKIKDTMHPAVQKCYKSALAATPFPPGQIATSFAAEFMLLGYANQTSWFLEIDQQGQINWHPTRGFMRSAAEDSSRPSATRL